MPSDSVTLLCHVISERDVAEHKARRLTITLADGSLVVWSSRGAIAWIEVSAPQFRTPDSLGVGSSLAQLLSLPGWEAGVGEGDDVVVLYTQSGDYCGLTFRLDAATALKVAGTPDLRAAIQRFANSGRVTEVWVRGRARCR